MNSILEEVLPRCERFKYLETHNFLWLVFSTETLGMGAGFDEENF